MREFDIDYTADWGASPVRVVDYKNDKRSAALIDGDEIVADSPEIEIVFDYPLSHRVTLFFSNDGKPFTRRNFWRAVHEGYTQIYREEDEAVGKTDNIPGMLNRQESEGPYGIWGHHIGDLYIEGVQEVKQNKFELLMGS